MKRILAERINDDCYKAEVLHDTFTEHKTGVLVEDKFSVTANTLESIIELCKRYNEYAVIWCYSEGCSYTIREAK